jgi:hypothetical protein
MAVVSDATVTVRVIRGGEEYGGWTLRAGEYILATDYNHEARVVTLKVGPPPQSALEQQVEDALDALGRGDADGAVDALIRRP